MMRKIDALPIGYSDVKSVIETGYYVDKTRYAQDLIEKRNPIFIARPRRFGKSLFIDTLATICNGEQEIFKDYHIGKPENGYNWKKYPVINLDLSRLTNDTPELLQLSIEDLLIRIASVYQLRITGQVLKTKLSNLVEDMTKLGNDYESKIVVLIDEYDAPIVHLTKGSDLEQANIKVMKDFFMTLKSLNKYFQFTFITGVSKFSLSDVFSGANHLKDITIDASADAMFGYTQEEMLTIFSKNLADIADQWNKKEHKKITESEVMCCMATYYNGYKFYEDGASVYNPWSTLRFLDSGKLEDYWYESGSPTILINQMLADPNRFQLDELPIDAYRHQLMYTGSRNEISLKALMFQTGYLTIDSYEPSTNIYKLKFPNQEIAKAFAQTVQDSLERRVKDYFMSTQDQIKSTLQSKDIESFIIAINIAFSSIPYYITSKTEKDYHSNLHMLLYGLNCLEGIHIRPLSKAIYDEQFLGEVQSRTAEYSGVFEEHRQASTPKLPLEIEFRERSSHMASEPPSSAGRADIVLTIGSIVYIIEIKYKASGKVALQQIKDNRYYTSYLWKAKEIILLGINFDKETKAIDSWAYETVNREALSKQMNK